jgi:hypothetical protein
MSFKQSCRPVYIFNHFALNSIGESELRAEDPKLNCLPGAEAEIANCALALAPAPFYLASFLRKTMVA